MSYDLQIKNSAAEVAAFSAEVFARLAESAVAAGNPFRVALSGGSTPKLLYNVLSAEPYDRRVPWDKIDFFFGDERWVRANDKDSNYKLANDELFTRLGVRSERIFPVPTVDLTPEKAADRYSATIRRVFGTPAGETPRFDLVFLGMGDDGHTCSLFPQTRALPVEDAPVTWNFVPKLNTNRITLTTPVLQHAATVLFMVAGESKAPALKSVLEGEFNPEEYPSQLLREAQGKVIWVVDRAAASQLGTTTPTQ